MIALVRSAALSISWRSVARFSSGLPPDATSRWMMSRQVEAGLETSTRTGLLQETVGELADFRRHRRREEERLAGEGEQLHDALDIGDEAHVEHAVGSRR